MRRHRVQIPKAALLFCEVAAFFWLLLPASAEAAWTREQGKWFVAQTLSSYRTNHFVDDSGNRIRQPAFHKQEWNGYVEYGLNEDLTLGGNFFLHRLSSDTRSYSFTSNSAVFDSEENYGLADSEFFLRRSLWQGDLFGQRTHFAVQPLIKLPSLYLEGGNPRSGTDNFDAELRLQSGTSFRLLSRNHFISADIAYRKRFGDWRDQLKADSALGLTLNNHIMLLSQVFLTQRIEGSNSSFNSNAVIRDYDLLKGQASVVYRINDSIRIQAGGFKHLHASNTGDGHGVFLSLWRDF